MKNSLPFTSLFRITRRNTSSCFLWIVMAVALTGGQFAAARQIDPATRDHYKTWSTLPQPLSISVTVRDQFMNDTLHLSGIEYLSNPVLKIHPPDTSNITKPDNHLTWYRAAGRDTLLSFTYVNQYESTAVSIDSVEYLLLPTQKSPHAPPESLDHYKAYRIVNPITFKTQTLLEDQFDVLYGLPELIDTLTARYFLTPAIKNSETQHLFDSVTHYVAYEISPRRSFPEPRNTIDQFGPHVLQIDRSKYLLVPSRKHLPQQPPGPSDTSKDHFKTWRTLPLPFNVQAIVQDQFMNDTLFLTGIELLSNPVLKVHQSDTFQIKKPDNHLTWYAAEGKTHPLTVGYVNQYESTAVAIDSVKYLLVPTQKLPHAPPESLDHYKAYHIVNPSSFSVQTILQDQFDLEVGVPEFIDSLKQMYFLTPAIKNMERQTMFDSVTHYTAYAIVPKRGFSLPVNTVDQFGPHSLTVQNSEFLLVPGKKIYTQVDTSGSIGGSKFNDLDCNGQQDAGEPGIAGWTINLAGPVNKSVITGAGGAFLFTGLPPGVYTVSEVLQPGWTQTLPPPPGTYLVPIVSGMAVTGIQFGNCQPPSPPDRNKEHYKTWRTVPLPIDVTVEVQDQFMTDTLTLTSIELLSNPTLKIHQADTFNIRKPDNHLTWYKASGKETYHSVEYVNQFESATIKIGPVEYLLLPTQKQPHSPPESLDHYKAYRVLNPKRFNIQTMLEDQFDVQVGTPEFLDSLEQAYFLTPALKNMPPPMFDSVTHYMAYEIDPKRGFSLPVNTSDQFGPHSLTVQNSQYLLVPTTKRSFGSMTCIPGVDTVQSMRLNLCDSLACANLSPDGSESPPLPSPSTAVEGIFRVYTGMNTSVILSFVLPTQVACAAGIIPVSFSATSAAWSSTNPPTDWHTFDPNITDTITVEMCDTIFVYLGISLCLPPTVSPGSCTAAASLLLASAGSASVPITVTILPCRNMHTVPVVQGWNLLSIPVNESRRAVDAYPMAVGQAFGYSGSYVVRDSMKPGEGYWLKFTADDTAEISGEGSDSLDIPVFTGWNMVAPVLDESISDRVIQPVGTSVTSNYFAYSGSYSVIPPESLKEGEAAWVKVSSNGSLRVVPAGGPNSMQTLANRGSLVDELLTTLNVLEISDRAKNCQKLYFGSSRLDKQLEGYLELPPTPPSGIFDARFSSNRMAEFYTDRAGGEVEFPIAVSAEQYPISLLVRIVDGKKVNLSVSSFVEEEEAGRYLLENGKEVVITDTRVKKLRLRVGSGRSLPTEYALYQNYPNPFNPASTIRYALPEEARVSLKIFNTLGQVVATLVDGRQEAGYQSVVWDAGNVTSGVYFYKLEAVSVTDARQSFTRVRKMVMIR